MLNFSIMRNDTGEPKARMSGLTSWASSMINRLDLAIRSGLSFGGKRDLNQTLGYHQLIQPEDYRAQYERGDIAERIIEAYPQATWVDGVTIYEDEDPEVITEFEQATIDLFTRLRVWSKLTRADILSGLGHYGVLLIGAKGEMSTPLPRMSGPSSVLYLTALSQDRATIDQEDRDSASPRFGSPVFYTLKLADNFSKRVHWSRVIHIAEGALEVDTVGKPRLRAIWNRLMDLQKLIGGGSEAAWRRMDPGMHLNLDPSVKLTPKDEAAIDAEFGEYLHGLRRTVRTRGMEVNPLNTAVTNFGPNVDTILQIVSGVTGIPQRILLGSERGELASTQDKGNFEDRVRERRHSFAEPVIRALVDRLIEHGALPQPADSYYIAWPESGRMSIADQATVALNITQANNHQNTAQPGNIIMSADEIRETIFGMEPLDTPDDFDDELDNDPDDSQEPTSDTISEARSAGYERLLFGESSRAFINELAGKSYKKLIGHKKTTFKSNLRGGFKGGVHARTCACMSCARAREGGGRTAPRSESRSAASTDPDWASVHRAADARIGLFTNAFVAAWGVGSASIDEGALEASIERRDFESIARILSEALGAVNAWLLDALPPLYTGTLIAGAEAALYSARSRGSWYSSRRRGLSSPPTRALAGFTASFDTAGPRVEAWARDRSSRLITEVSPFTQAAVAELVAVGVRDGHPPKALVRDIKATVGLRSDQLAALERFRAKGHTEREVGQYRNRLHNQRALLIGRTETMRSANAGQVELWRQAQDKGDLPENQERGWIVTDDDRLRRKHANMRGRTAPLDKPFKTPGGQDIEPGEEPNCRCAQGLKRPKKAKKPAADAASRDPELIATPLDSEEGVGYVNDNLPIDVRNTRRFKQAVAERKDSLYGLDASLLGQEDTILKELLHERGFDGLPGLVDQLPPDHEVLHRGVAGPYSDAFRTGDLWVGRGGGGSGTYFARGENGLAIASSFSGGDGVVMRAALKAEARVVQLADINNLRDSYIESFGDDLDWMEEILIGRAVSNPSWLAALLGYDAIIIDASEMVILNRTALLVEKLDVSI